MIVTTDYILPVLDPGFNYKKLSKAYANDPELLKYFEQQKSS
jgi:hypothetical protein